MYNVNDRLDTMSSLIPTLFCVSHKVVSKKKKKKIFLFKFLKNQICALKDQEKKSTSMIHNFVLNGKMHIY